jgi:restriction system protein
MARRQSFFNELLGFGLTISRRLAGLLAARSVPTISVASMSWREFERLIGEAFRRRGYAVTGFGGLGPAGSVDLGLMKNGERFLVQCKHWRKHQVGVTVVRELKGVMAAHGAQGGFVITGGQFTREAREYAESCKVRLIAGASLDELIGHIRCST